MLDIKFVVQVLKNQKHGLDSQFRNDFQQPYKEKSSEVYNAKQPQDMFHLVLPAYRFKTRVKLKFSKPQKENILMNGLILLEEAEELATFKYLGKRIQYQLQASMVLRRTHEELCSPDNL